MSYRLPIALLCLCLCAACAREQAYTPEPEAATPTPTLTPAWTAEGFMTPESVYYDADRGVLYVANINGDGTAKDGNGFISQLSPAGEVLNLEWVSGLDAPKGMALAGNTLYVSDIDQLVAIDVAQGVISQRHPAPEAVFLNDVILDDDGSVYVSDTRGNKLYRMTGDGLEIWLRDGPIDRPNGLFMHNGELLVGVQNKVLAITPATQAVRTYIDSTATGAITDGLMPTGTGGYFTTNWHGGTWLIHPERPTHQLLDTSADTINAADVAYIAEQRLLLIPTFFDNRVMAYTYTE